MEWRRQPTNTYAEEIAELVPGLEIGTLMDEALMAILTELRRLKEIEATMWKGELIAVGEKK